MVQKNATHKFGIQSDHVKFDKQLGNLKPISCQDGKNRGSDMKKKMKRSRSIKLSDIESFKSSPLRKTVSPIGKSLPFNAQNTVATPVRQRMIRSPNYMKSTSTSEARKESSQVSPSSTSTGSDSKNPRRRNSSNLKLVKTLTKSPSFKPVRSTGKKCSTAALCTDIDVQKATCSSTLKDSKFPAYLMLNPGGTEAEGTSVLKVCPYTYCSLNGHHHTPLPPLKCFLKPKRRSLKAQKSANLEFLSSCRPKLSGDGTEEIRRVLQVFSDDKPANKEIDSTDLAKVPLVKEENDFFIEIYAKNTADGTEAIEKHTEDGEGTIGVAGKTNEAYDGKKHLFDASQRMESDFEENFEKNNHAHSDVIWITEGFLQQQEAEEAEADCPPMLTQEEAKTERCDRESDIEGENHASMGEDDTISEATDMEWEEGQLSASESDTETHHLDKYDEESCISVWYLSDIKKLDLIDEPEIIILHDIVSRCTEETLVDEVLQELFEEDSASSGTLCNDSDTETESMMHIWEILEPKQVGGDFTHDQLSSIEDAFEEPSLEEKSEEADRDLTGGVTTSTGEPIVESAVANEIFQEDGICEMEHIIIEKNSQVGDAANSCGTSLVAEALNRHQDDKYFQANSKLSMGVDISDSSESFSGSDQGDAKLNANQNHTGAKSCLLDEISEDNRSNLELVNENSHSRHCDHVADNQNACEEGNEALFKTPTSDAEEQSDSNMHSISSAGKDGGEIEKMEVEVCTMPDAAETLLVANNRISLGSCSRFLHRGSNSGQENARTCNNRKWTIKCKKPIMDLVREQGFNPREPNFLPVVPDPEAEKVDLRHQIMDDRKNAEEWMLDCALRQAVTKLDPARKRKVALLVEAFEKVLPVPTYEHHIRHPSAAFSRARSIQACS